MEAKKTPKVITSKTDNALMPISIEDVQDKIIVLRERAGYSRSRFGGVVWSAD